MPRSAYLRGIPVPVDGEIDGVWGPTQAVTRLQPVLDLVRERLGIKLRLETTEFDAHAPRLGTHDPACV